MKMYLLPMVVILTACGTTSSLSKTDSEITATLNTHRTACESVTRVYGGVAYDICRLNALPNSSFYNPFLIVYLLDMPISAVIDTVVLPYTIVRQSQDGNIELTK